MSSRRPRRSRVYDLNYNIAENYYKSAIDRLDEKYHSRPASILTRHSEPPATSPVRRPRFEAAVEDLEDGLEYSRERASRAIQKETILDQRASRKGVELEASFDGQVARTLERIQASKKLLNSLDVDNSYDSNETASSKIIKKRSVKVVSDISQSSAIAQSSNELTKWSKMSDYNDSESFAQVRARQSAARLQDIEQDMQERSERQFAREQRAANVKKLLADTSDTALTNGVSSLKITKTTQKRITSY